MGSGKRSPGRLPRIPFSASQLQSLEQAYRHSNYLSAEEANQLAIALNLSNARVKIWFQNRRARERRDKRAQQQEAELATVPQPETIDLIPNTSPTPHISISMQDKDAAAIANHSQMEK